MGGGTWEVGCGVGCGEAGGGVGRLRRRAAEGQSGDYRPPGLAVHGPAIAVMNKVEYPVEIENLSQNGAGVLHKGELEAGAPLELVLGGDVRRSGVVRWSRDGRAGIWFAPPLEPADLESRSEEHTSELQSLMRNQYAVFCLKTKTTHHNKQN